MLSRDVKYEASFEEAHLGRERKYWGEREKDIVKGECLYKIRDTCPFLLGMAIKIVDKEKDNTMPNP